MNWGIISIVLSVAAFAVAEYFYGWIVKQPGSTKEMESIGLLICQSAETFLNREYNVLAKLVGIVAIIIIILLPSPI